MSNVTPDETAEFVLYNDLARYKPSYRWFREQMIAEHPEPLDEQVIHDLYVKHVTNWSPSASLNQQVEAFAKEREAKAAKAAAMSRLGRPKKKSIKGLARALRRRSSRHG